MKHNRIGTVALHLELIDMRGPAIAGIEMDDDKFWGKSRELTVRFWVLFKSPAVCPSQGVIHVKEYRFILFLRYLQSLWKIP